MGISRVVYAKVSGMVYVVVAGMGLAATVMVLAHLMVTLKIPLELIKLLSESVATILTECVYRGVKKSDELTFIIVSEEV